MKFISEISLLTSLQQYLKLANQFSISPDDHETIAEQILHKPELQLNGDSGLPDIGAWIHDAKEKGYTTGPGATAVVEGVEAYRTLAGHLGLRDAYVTPNNCQVAAEVQIKESMEHDFTTNGIRGNLRCPFAKSDRNQPVVQVEDGKPELCGNDDLDPIKAEIHSRHQSIASASGTSAVAARCPIRYLDDHSPEALAEYFEKHKHEIPRSHAICIQRYQRNAQSLRELDEKYGDLVTMVKGLGKYHQPYLPSNQGVSDARDPASIARVEKWAEDVSMKSPPDGEVQAPNEGQQIEGDHDRENHFDRPLKEIRVGESPGRPWGIHVPISEPAIDSELPSPAIPIRTDALQGDWTGNTTSPRHPSPAINGTTEHAPSAATKRCPFHVPATLRSDKGSNTAEKLPEPQAEPLSTNQKGGSAHIPSVRTAITSPTPDPSHAEHQPPPAQPKVVFNGPVFFGYSPEAAAVFLEKLGSSIIPK